MTDQASNTAATQADQSPAAINSKAPSQAGTAAIAHPNVKFMLQHPAHMIALGFGSGLSRIAPGTVGTLWAWLAFLVLQLWLDKAQIGWLIAASLPLGWWACTVTAQHMRVADPGHIVWDEIVAMWIILWLCMPLGFWGQLLCFALFRFFDAVKPQPVKWADRLFKGFGPRGGWGIMWDDLVAAFCTLLVIALWKHFF
ncbi:phosphatidylglycerophosphatase A [Comamonas resistens]|uniref:phosphatidylglycerophosphatase A family protein n=1 Tax=Comamonas resistens TaxID=3046670 RepID=UPI0039BD62C0